MSEIRLYPIPMLKKFKIYPETENNESLSILGAYFVARVSIEKMLKKYRTSVKTLEKSINDLTEKKAKNKLDKTGMDRLSNDISMLPRYTKKYENISREYDYRISNAFDLIPDSLYVVYANHPDKYSTFQNAFSSILTNTFIDMELSVNNPESITYIIFHFGYKLDTYSFEKKAVSLKSFKKMLLDIISQRLFDEKFIDINKYQYSFGSETYKQSSNILNELTFKDFVVRGNTFHCIHNDHHTENIKAIVKIMTPSSQVITKEIPAGYCEECSVYFILENTYEKLLEHGIPLCRIIDAKSYGQNGPNSIGALAKESILKQCGYNVSEKNSLSDLQRQKILTVIIENNILSETDIISYLDFFINQHKSKKNYKFAINKWESDKEFLTTLLMKEKAQRKVGVSSLKSKKQ